MTTTPQATSDSASEAASVLSAMSDASAISLSPASIMSLLYLVVNSLQNWGYSQVALENLSIGYAEADSEALNSKETTLNYDMENGIDYSTGKTDSNATTNDQYEFQQISTTYNNYISVMDSSSSGFQSSYSQGQSTLSSVIYPILQAILGNGSVMATLLGG